MRRIALLAIAISLLAGLAAAPSAFGIKAGFNLATKRLEAAYKVALFERRFDPEGCYPAPAELAKDIQGIEQAEGRAWPGTRGSLGNVNQVYVLKQGTNCEHLRMALRAVGGIYVLDSKLGTVRLQGRKGASTPGLARRLTNLILATRTFRLTKPDTAPRLETLCPGGRYPIGGGMIAEPAHRRRRRGHLSALLRAPRRPARLAHQRRRARSRARAARPPRERHGAGDLRLRRHPGDPHAAQDRLPAGPARRRP